MKRYNFRKISARDPDFMYIREQNKDFLKEYHRFNDRVSLLKGAKKSGKASSYSGYLVRMALFIFEEHGIYDMTSSSFFNKLLKIRLIEDFERYNQSEKGFPNSAINEYFKYWALFGMENEFIVHEDDIDFTDTIKWEDRPVKIPDRKREAKLTDIIPRNQALSLLVKEKSNWKCHLNEQHETFISRFNDKPFVESHHLIPLSYQANYQYSLDVPSNLVALCPNCHRKIHLGTDDVRKKMLDDLYYERENRLKKSGIEIDLITLYIYYGIG